MKSILKEIKSVLSSSTVLSYIKKFEIVSPRLLPDISSSQVPYIGIAPVSTSESWVAQRKQAVHRVELYCVNYIQLMENSIIGDTVKPGLLDVVNDVESVIRGHRLPISSTNYLSKPIEISSVDYSVTQYGDQFYLFVASLSLECIRLFNITLP